MLYFQKNREIILFKSLAMVSENVPKIMSITGLPLWRKYRLKNWKFCCFWRLLFPKQKLLPSSIFYYWNISANNYHFWILYIHWSAIFEIRGCKFCYFGSLDTAENNLITDKGKQHFFERYYQWQCLMKVSSFLTHGP